MTLQILFEQCSRAPGWLFDIGDYTTQLYEDLMGIIVRQYKDPYKPISMMESHRGLNVPHLTCKYHHHLWLGIYNGMSYGVLNVAHLTCKYHHHLWLGTLKRRIQ